MAYAVKQVDRESTGFSAGLEGMPWMRFILNPVAYAVKQVDRESTGFSAGLEDTSWMWF